MPQAFPCTVPKIKKKAHQVCLTIRLIIEVATPHPFLEIWQKGCNLIEFHVIHLMQKSTMPSFTFWFIYFSHDNILRLSKTCCGWCKDLCRVGLCLIFSWLLVKIRMLISYVISFKGSPVAWKPSQDWLCCLQS